jgi:GTP-binding protein Era
LLPEPYLGNGATRKGAEQDAAERVFGMFSAGKSFMNCGYVALNRFALNVGKSTLMNHLLKQKISITSRKPQNDSSSDFRYQYNGIRTDYHIDTPGCMLGKKKALNRQLNHTADTTLLGVDVIVWLIDGLAWHAYDDVIFSKLKKQDYLFFSQR